MREKPLYEKTVDFGNLPNNAQESTPHGILDADIIWIAGGYVSTPQYGNYSILGNSNPKNLPSQWTFWVTRSEIFCITGTDRTGSTAIIVLRYTKTTD